MTLSTRPAQGMGPNYHHLHGLSQPNLLHCTEAEARKLAAVDDLLEALQDMVSDRDCLSEATVNFARAAIAKAQGEQA